MKLLQFITLYCLFTFSTATIFSQSFHLDNEFNCSEVDNSKVEYYVLDFWATWCGPCVQSLPHMNQLQESNPHDNFKFIAVSNEHQAIIQKFMKYHTPISSCVGIDKDFSIMKNYGHKYVPVVLILDTEGNLLWEGNPLELDTSILDRIHKKQKVSMTVPNHTTEFSLSGPTELEGSEVSLSSGGAYTALDMKGKSISNMYSQILLLREGDYVKLRVENSPANGFRYDCYCKTDTLHYSKTEFYNHCIENLNTSLKADLQVYLDTFDYYEFYVKDTALLFSHHTLADSSEAHFNDDYFTFRKYPIKYFIPKIASLYNLDTDFSHRTAHEFYEQELDLRIANVELEQLRDELEKVGLSYKVIQKPEKVYTVVFE